MKQVAENIYRMKSSWISPRMRAANLYLIQGDSRSLLVDAGFCTQASQETVGRLLCQLAIPWDCLDVFVTHNHPDHAGLAKWLWEQGAQILMKQEETKSCPIGNLYRAKPIEQVSPLLRGYGFSEKHMRHLIHRTLQPEYAYQDYPWEGYPVTDVREGEHLYYGGYDFEVLALPGHTGHQMGLAEREHKWLFTSDTLSKRQVLVLGSLRPGSDLLHQHLHTLDRLMQEFPDFWVVPGHYSPFYGTKKAVQNTKRYFAHMLQKVTNVLKDAGEALTLVQVVQRAFRYEPGAFFQEEVLKTHFRLANTLSCLDELVRCGILTLHQAEGIWYWRYL